MNVTNVAELYAYDRWANAQIMEASLALTEEQLHKPLGASYVSVFGTLRHILWGEWLWLRRWQALSKPYGPDPSTLTQLSVLRQHWSAFEQQQTAFLATLRDADLDRIVSYENPPGTPWSYSLRHMLQHVANHSTYHRGQVVTLLRQLGAHHRPTDFLVFFDLGLDAGA